MSVVFSADSWGKATSFEVSGATPLITLDVDPALDQADLADYAAGKITVANVVSLIPGFHGTGMALSVLGAAGGNTGWANATLRDVSTVTNYQSHKLSNHWNEKFNDWFSAPGGLGSDKWKPRPIRELATNMEQRRDLMQQLNATKDPDMRMYLNNVLRNTRRAEMSLTDMLKGVGMITSISGKFEDKIAEGAATVPKAVPQTGNMTISGLVFERSCEETGKGGIKEGRHGLERLFEYYYWHRLTNTEFDKPTSAMSVSIGKTKIQGWVVGFSFKPAKPEYRLWSWDVHLITSPNYWVKSLGL